MQIALVYLQPFRRNSLLKYVPQPKIAKNSLNPLIWGPYFRGLRSFKVIDVNIPEKLVACACYDKRHVCAYLQPFS